jgi:hypothetical protein
VPRDAEDDEDDPEVGDERVGEVVWIGDDKKFIRALVLTRFCFVVFWQRRDA